MVVFSELQPMAIGLIVLTNTVLNSVVISELKDHIYFAQLRVKKDGEIIEIDSRPSDAIAVAVACDPILPIFVSEEVLEESNSGG